MVRRIKEHWAAETFRIFATEEQEVYHPAINKTALTKEANAATPETPKITKLEKGVGVEALEVMRV